MTQHDTDHPSLRSVTNARISIPLQGPIKGPTIQGELAEARAIIARLDDETDTLRAEKAAVERDLAECRTRGALAIAGLQNTIGRWIDICNEQAGKINAHDELLRRVANAKAALDGLLPGEQ